MLAIKLRPVGKKKQISYRVVVMEKKSKLVGKFIEDLGWYNPHTNLSSVNKDRVDYWIKNGAQPTDSVHNLLVREKVQEGPKIPKHGKSKKTKEEAPQAPQEEPKVNEAQQGEVKAEEAKTQAPQEPPKEEEKAEVQETEKTN